MVYFLDAAGTLLRCVPERVYRGSAEANKIVLVAPFSESCAVSAAFSLPDGAATRPYLLAYEGRLGAAENGTENGTENGDAEGAGESAGESGADARAYVWSLALPACVSAQSGRAAVQFFCTDAAGACTASACIPFTVECGVETLLPAEEDAGAYADVLAVLAQVTGSLADGAYPARALRTCNEGAAYGAGEVVFVPAGTGHGAALVRSLAENNAQPPYSAEGALSSAWEEVFSFSSLLEEFGQQLGAFAATNVLFVAQLPAVGAEDTLYAVVSAEDASLFTLYAYADGWVALGSKGVQLLPDEHAVLFTAQQLTEEQQAQARQNIGAQAAAADAVTAPQLEAGLASQAAVLNEGESAPAGMRTGGSVYTYALFLPEAGIGQSVAANNFTDPSFSPDGWTVVNGGGEAPSFGADGLRIAEGLYAQRGAAAVANPFKGFGLTDGLSVVLYGSVTGGLRNDYESIFGFSGAADSANSAFNFFAVTSNGTGVRFNVNGAGNLGETYYDITGGALLDMTAPSLYVLTVTDEAIRIYLNGEKKAEYAYASGGANTAYRTDTLTRIAQMDWFVLGCCTGQLEWGNPAMNVQRAVLCSYALDEDEVQAMYAGSYYRHTVRVGASERAVAAERAVSLITDGETGLWHTAYFTAEGAPAENPHISLRSGSAPFYSYSVAVGKGAEAAESGVAVGEDAQGLGNGVAVGAESSAAAQCAALGTLASAGGGSVTNAVAIGYNAAATSANSMQLGGSGNSYIYYYGTLASRSDERDKADLTDFDDEQSLAFVTSLRTFSYVRNPRGLYEYTEEERAGAARLHKEYGLGPYDTAAHAAGTKKGSRRRAGLSAQDVQQKMRAVFGADVANLVCDSLYDRRQAGEAIPEGIESQLEVSYLSLVPFLISAMRAQQTRIAALETALATRGEEDGAEESAAE